MRSILTITALIVAGCASKPYASMVVTQPDGTTVETVIYGRPAPLVSLSAK